MRGEKLAAVASMVGRLIFMKIEVYALTGIRGVVGLGFWGSAGSAHLRQIGHFSWCPMQSSRQVLQNECPHTVVTGLCRWAG